MIRGAVACRENAAFLGKKRDFPRMRSEKAITASVTKNPCWRKEAETSARYKQIIVIETGGGEDRVLGKQI
jgi:hypothetical protein